VDDRSGHFFISVGRICEDAAVGGLPVSVRIGSGETVLGVPEPPAVTGESGLDSTGYEDGLCVGERRLDLHDVVEIAIRRPVPTGD